MITSITSLQVNLFSKNVDCSVYVQVLGLVAIILTCVAWGNATIFTLKEDYRTLVCPYDNKGDFLPSKENCSLQNLNQAQKCDNRNERYAAANKPLKICPSRWLVIPAMIIFGVTWFITSLLFIPLCICLLKNDGFFLLVSYSIF